MTNFEFLAFLFVGFLAAIVFGVFVGLAIADRRLQRQRYEMAAKDSGFVSGDWEIGEITESTEKWDRIPLSAYKFKVLESRPRRSNNAFE